MSTISGQVSYILDLTHFSDCKQINHFFSAKLKAQGKLAEQMNVPLKTTKGKLTTADIGPPTNVKTLHSNEIPTTTADSIDKPIQNVEKQGTVKKWFSNIFSTPEKPKLTTKDIGPPTDLKKNDASIYDIFEPRPPEHRTFIPSSAQQQSTMINMNNEKPVEISIVETPVIEKIDTLHVQKPPKDKKTDKKLANLFGSMTVSDTQASSTRQRSSSSSPTSSPAADKRAKYESSSSPFASTSKYGQSSSKYESSSPIASTSKYGQSSSKYESSSPIASSSKYGQSSSKYESSSSSSSPFSSKYESSSTSSSPLTSSKFVTPSSSASSSPTQSRYEPRSENKRQFYRKFAGQQLKFETSSSSDNSPASSPQVARKKKRSIPLETTTTTTTDNQSQQQQPSQSDQISINLVKDPTNTNKNLTNLTNIIVNLDKINIDPNVKMP